MQFLHSIVNFKFSEKINRVPSKFKIYWEQGDFFFNNEKRVATVTDVKFIDKNTIVVAHREAAKLYLIKFESGKAIVISEKRLKTTLLPSLNKFYHPDLIAIDKSNIYITDYTNRIALVEIKNNRFILKKTYNLPGNEYHGCFFESGKIYLGGVRYGELYSFQINDEIKETYKIENIDGINNEKLRIKTVCKYEDTFVLGLDIPKGSAEKANKGGDSWIGFFSLDKNILRCIDITKLKNSQLDGHTFYKNKHYFTIHDGVQKGFVKVIEFKNQKIYNLASYHCKSFPHGIDIFQNQLAITSYKESCIDIYQL